MVAGAHGDAAIAQLGFMDSFDGCNRLRSKLEDGAVYLSIERFCAVEGDGKELAKL